MYVTKSEREEVANTIRAAVEDVYKTPKYYEANDVILSPTQVSEVFPFITQHFLKRYGWCIPRERVDKWVTGKELTKLYPCFSTSWLRQNGCYLPRTRATIYDDDGNEQNSKWGYSLNRIKKLLNKDLWKLTIKDTISARIRLHLVYSSGTIS